MTVGNGNLKTWLKQWLTTGHQRVLVNGVSSSATPVRPGVPRGTVLGPLMFLLYINDIGKNKLTFLRMTPFCMA